MAVISKLKQSDSLSKIFRLYKRLIIKYVYGLKKVHPTFNIAGEARISRDLIAGEYSYIGRNCRIYPGVSIGRYTMLAHNVQIIGDDHIYDIAGTPSIFSGRPELKKTKIGRDVWIGADSIVFTGVEIGDGAIIAAGAVVTKSIPKYVVVGGIPAKVIKRRFASVSDELKHTEMLNGPLLRSVRNKPLKISKDN